MASPVVLRSDFGVNDLCRLARQSRNANQARRLLAVAAIYGGARRDEAARIGGVGRQIVRDWVVRFNELGPEGLIDRKQPGATPRLTDAHRRALVARVEAGPIPAVHGVVRWRLVDLVQWVWEEFHVSVSKDTLSRELRRLGYRKLSARPRHHAQNPTAIEDFKKKHFPKQWRRSRRVQHVASP